jgi:hypothetical protein
MTYTLQDPLTNARGGKSAPLGKDGEKVFLQLGSKECPVYSPFGVSRFDENARPALEIDIPPNLVAEVRAIESAVKNLITKNSLALFKVTLTATQVEESFHSSISQRGDYPTKLKTKIGVNTRFWGDDGSAISPDTSLRGVSLVGKCILSGVWLMGVRSFGISYTLTDVLPFPAPTRPCPFL